MGKPPPRIPVRPGRAAVLASLEKTACFYGPKLIFKDVSLEVREGTVLLLAGANGAGKSTLLRILAGLVRPSAGLARLAEGVTLGYLGHQTFIYPQLSARENLAFWDGLHMGGPAPNARIDAVLERVELASFAEEKAGTFSRGMAQRLNLARILLLEPGLLLLDEPATGLDQRSTAMLHREIATARARGAGVVWITHSLAEDLARADAVALLENRRLAWHGPATEFPARPASFTGERSC